MTKAPAVATVLLASIVLSGPALAGTHKFEISCADGHRAFVKAKYGDVDPGKEWARVSVAKKFAAFHGNACSASDYKGDSQCPNCQWEEFEAASLSGDELARLGQGDVTVIPEVVVGVPLKTAENVGKELERVGRRVGRLFR
jgi:hypothetical protein